METRCCFPDSSHSPGPPIVPDGTNPMRNIPAYRRYVPDGTFPDGFFLVCSCLSPSPVYYSPLRLVFRHQPPRGSSWCDILSGVARYFANTGNSKCGGWRNTHHGRAGRGSFSPLRLVFCHQPPRALRDVPQGIPK